MRRTPGPWRFAEARDEDVVRVLGDDDSLVTEMPFNLPPLGVGTREEAETARADGRLIAAAPELLEILRLAVDRCSKDDEVWLNRAWTAQALAAIAKAEGTEE